VPLEMPEPDDGKLSSPVLRGERGRKAPDLPGANIVINGDDNANSF